jgi:hypothetical protein
VMAIVTNGTDGKAHKHFKEEVSVTFILEN